VARESLYGNETVATSPHLKSQPRPHLDPKKAQGILLHATSVVTMDIYTHAQDDVKRKALEKFEARLVQ